MKTAVHVGMNYIYVASFILFVYYCVIITPVVCHQHNKITLIVCVTVTGVVCCH